MQFKIYYKQKIRLQQHFCLKCRAFINMIDVFYCHLKALYELNFVIKY
jgi:hypothetical protein